MTLTKKEAADYLEITVRAIENAVAKGKLDAQKVKGMRGTEWRFEQEELERYKVARETVSFVLGKSVVTSQALAPIEKPDLERIICALETISITPKSDGVPVEAKLTLSLDEASQLSGFSTTQLREAIKAEKLRTVPVGKSGKRKRIRREDLDGYIQKL